MTKDDESSSCPFGTVVELSREECVSLLATQSVGRLARNRPGAPPLVAPVNYRLDGEQIIFGLDRQLKPQVLHHSEVSFEVDWIDWEHRMG
jgi:nitroimidazol reductase NimA-like FMN-containing flavoprotein (pyridoxamine 5'-phosphate oxidase superfamily)